MAPNLHRSEAEGAGCSQEACRTLGAILFSMPSESTDVLSPALALPVQERARIAHELILSLDDGADADAVEAWVAELEKRAREVRFGAVKTAD